MMSSVSAVPSLAEGPLPTPARLRPRGETALVHAVKLLDTPRHESGGLENHPPGTVPPVPLLTVDPEFAAAIPVADRALAARTLQLRRYDLDAGQPFGGVRRRSAGPGNVALLVVSGLLSRNVVVCGRSSPELFGPGDLIDAADLVARDDHEEIRWAVHQPAVLAVLDGRFTLASQRWPGLWRTVARRLTERSQRLASQLAALQLSRVEDRVLTVLWQLADRWGRVTPAGVVVPVFLTHQLLGQLVAAKRPTVSLALTALAEQQRLVRREDGSWLLPEGSRPTHAS